MSNGLPVKYNDDGEPYVEADALKAVLAQGQEQIDELKEALVYQASTQTLQNEGQKTLDAIVGEKEEWGVANQRLTSARQWLGDVCNQYLDESGMREQGVNFLSGSQAIERFVGTPVEESFNKQFPGMKMATALIAEDSSPQLRSALDEIADGMDIARPKSDMSKFDVVDPLKLAGVGKEYSDKQVAKIEEALRKEEEDGFLN